MGVLEFKKTILKLWTLIHEFNRLDNDEERKSELEDRPEGNV